MKYVNFFGHEVSKLIVGDNPFNGHSYITAFISREEMLDYNTEDKILDAIHKMEELGVNTMLPLADPYIIRILQRYRRNGGKMNFIFQTYAPFMINPDIANFSIGQMLSVDPLGIYISGTFTDVRFETGRSDEITDMIQLFRNHEQFQEKCPKLGLGTHHPELIAHCEKEKWDIDFYMACMYDLRRGREGEESGFITGKNKSSVHPIIPSDRDIMLRTLKNVEKPIIAFKIFAGGQMLVEKEEAERRALIKDAYNTIFHALKPDDFAVMGIFQKYHDQLTENVDVFNEWCQEQK
ncbi:MAG: hypothetical protein E7399_04525 [Ruminococcaceae bacterium]|nr:hypothetical protein [Oscillospiraceae bacterium]